VWQLLVQLCNCHLAKANAGLDEPIQHGAVIDVGCDLGHVCMCLSPAQHIRLVQDSSQPLPVRPPSHMLEVVAAKLQ
jgi:hypothetical protein